MHLNAPSALRLILEGKQQVQTSLSYSYRRMKAPEGQVIQDQTVSVGFLCFRESIFEETDEVSTVWTCSFNPLNSKKFLDVYWLLLQSLVASWLH